MKPNPPTPPFFTRIFAHSSPPSPHNHTTPLQLLLSSQPPFLTSIFSLFLFFFAITIALFSHPPPPQHHPSASAWVAREEAREVAAAVSHGRTASAQIISRDSASTGGASESGNWSEASELGGLLRVVLPVKGRSLGNRSRV